MGGGGLSLAMGLKLIAAPGGWQGPPWDAGQHRCRSITAPGGGLRRKRSPHLAGGHPTGQPAPQEPQTLEKSRPHTHLTWSLGALSAPSSICRGGFLTCPCPAPHHPSSPDATTSALTPLCTRCPLLLMAFKKELAPSTLGASPSGQRAHPKGDAPAWRSREPGATFWTTPEDAGGPHKFFREPKNGRIGEKNPTIWDLLSSGGRSCCQCGFCDAGAARHAGENGPGAQNVLFLFNIGAKEGKKRAPGEELVAACRPAPAPLTSEGSPGGFGARSTLRGGCRTPGVGLEPGKLPKPSGMPGKGAHPAGAPRHWRRHRGCWCPPRGP